MKKFWLTAMLLSTASVARAETIHLEIVYPSGEHLQHEVSVADGNTGEIELRRDKESTHIKLWLVSGVLAFELKQSLPGSEKNSSVDRGNESYAIVGRVRVSNKKQLLGRVGAPKGSYELRLVGIDGA